jgi:uncharacterized DUF497 family protein
LDKHGVAFDEAATVFKRKESEDAVTIRIISSRKATKQESKTYGE